MTNCPNCELNGDDSSDIRIREEGGAFYLENDHWPHHLDVTETVVLQGDQERIYIDDMGMLNFELANARSRYYVEKVGRRQLRGVLIVGWKTQYHCNLCANDPQHEETKNTLKTKGTVVPDDDPWGMRTIIAELGDDFPDWWEKYHPGENFTDWWNENYPGEECRWTHHDDYEYTSQDPSPQGIESPTETTPFELD